MIFPNLNKSDRAILEGLLLGSGNEQLAKEIGIKEGAMKLRIRRIGMKLGLTDRVPLAMFVHEHRKVLGVNCGFCQD